MAEKTKRTASKQDPEQAFLMNIQRKEGGGLLNFSKAFLKHLPTSTLRFGFNASLGRIIIRPETEADRNTLEVIDLGNGGRISNQGLVNFCKARGFAGKLLFSYSKTENAYYSHTADEMKAFLEAKELTSRKKPSLEIVNDKMLVLQAEIDAQAKTIKSSQTKYASSKKVIADILKRIEAETSEGQDTRDLYKTLRAKEALLSAAERDIRRSQKDLGKLKRGLATLKKRRNTLTEV